MANMSVDKVINKIKDDTDLSEDEIQSKIDSKVKELGGLVSREGAAHIIANKVGVKLFKPDSSGKLEIGNLMAGLKSVDIVGRVIKIYPVNEFEKDGKQRKVASFLIGDKTGKTRVTLWDTNQIMLIEDKKLEEGDVVHIDNGYVKEGKYNFEVHLNSKSKLRVNPEEVEKELPSVQEIWGEKEKEEAQRTDISEIEEGNFEIRGTVVHVFQSKPYYKACPECNKKLKDSSCETHGEVDPKHVLVLSLILDDGTGNIRVTSFRDTASKILGVGGQTAYEKGKENDNPSYVVEEMKSSILGKEYVMEGRVKKSDFSGDLEMISNEVHELDPVKESKKILGE